ncbi:MAG: 4-demethylwyosine synthase TYW1 [Candidatus Aenigmarchaeota archaeon]|nr:4-demethylwyosine synthase TYW1 [Candidatus Aenigmarchaeota archaeon]
MIDQSLKNRVMDERMKKYEAMGYRFVGPNKHSAIKVCQWCKASLRETGSCYKQKFYGIGSNQCLQMTPTFFTCSENCSFCWRPLRYALPQKDQQWDSPKEIMDDAIAAHREILQGFKGNPHTPILKFQQAQDPKHVAISLSGEPTLYPMIGDLIDDIHGRGMTAFLVTNGTHPDRLQQLLDDDQQPTQMYVTLAAPDRETLVKTALPMYDDAWDRLQRSLSLLNRFKRSVIRLTLVKGLNFVNPQGYAQLAERAQCDFLEVKAFMAVGGARDRLAYADMPLFPEIQAFAREIEKSSSYRIVDEKADSRVVLMTNQSSSPPSIHFSE